MSFSCLSHFPLNLPLNELEPAMKTAPALQHPHLVRLGAGESLLFQTRAGTSLISTSGSLLVTGTPCWLGEQVFRTRMPLEPGQVHPLGQDGWITLTAGPHGGAVCLVQREGRSMLMGALHKAGKKLLRIARIARTGLRGVEPV